MAFPVADQNLIKANAGALVRQLDRSFLQVQQFKAWLDTFTDAQLNVTWGFAQADIDVLRSTFGDLKQLDDIYLGTASLVAAKDFRTFGKQLYLFGSV